MALMVVKSSHAPVQPMLPDDREVMPLGDGGLEGRGAWVKERPSNLGASPGDAQRQSGCWAAAKGLEWLESEGLVVCV